MLGRDEKMQPGLFNFPNFAQRFCFASSEAISEAREFPKTHQVGFRQGCDKVMVVHEISCSPESTNEVKFSSYVRKFLGLPLKCFVSSLGPEFLSVQQNLDRIKIQIINGNSSLVIDLVHCEVLYELQPTHTKNLINISV